MDAASMAYFLIIFSTEVLITGNVVAKDLRAEQKAMTVFNAYPLSAYLAYGITRVRTL